MGLIRVKNSKILGGVALALAMLFVAPVASADETQARDLFKAMSDYLGKQKKISFNLDTSLDVVTRDQQKLSIASSGAVTLTRPNKIHVTRKGGFADTELFFDGKTLSVLRKDQNLYAKSEIPGSIDNLVEVLRNKLQRPLPAADLLAASVFDEMMPLVTDVKDLGSGVIRGIECDHLAFRSDDVDWQIWITQGSRPRPMRFTITSSKVAGSPQYQVDVMNFKANANVPDFDFNFVAPVGSKQVEPEQLGNFDELPEIYKP